MFIAPSEKQMEEFSEDCKKSIQGISETLNQPLIDARKLRAYLANGLPQEIYSIRQVAWKVILGYLPKNRHKWEEQQEKQRSHYYDFVQHYIPAHRYQDYPLIMNKQHPQWKQYEKDYYLWQQIQKDTSRTQSQLAFFSQFTQPMMIPFLTPVRRQKWKTIFGNDKETMAKWKQNRQEHRKTYRFDYMTRILYIFAKVNPRAQYVQGMNQIIAPIFYLLNHRNKGRIQEAACFFMFNNVMSDLLQLNIQDFDKRQNGIHSRMREVDRILLATQPLLWQKMNTLKIDQLYYCFRWLTLLFAQQFELFQILRIWQSIFACEDRALYVNCFCVSLLTSIKIHIMAGTYSSVLTLLKNISDHVNCNDAIFRAFQLYHEFRGLDVNTIAHFNRKKLQKKQEKGDKKDKKEMKKSKSQKPKIFQKIIKKFM